MTSPTEIIAEIGVNHNGSLKQALRMVDSAKECGADTVKFQYFKARKLTTNHDHIKFLEKLELKPRELRVIIRHCQERAIKFLCTPFDEETAKDLFYLGVDRFKIGSGEITDTKLLLLVGSTMLPIIMSTGMSSTEDIGLALGYLTYGYLNQGTNPPYLPAARWAGEARWDKEGEKYWKNQVTLLHCVSEYPCPIDHLNLRSITHLIEKFGTKVGFSDHSTSTLTPSLAVAMGAQVIEKHFTLNKDDVGPDHKSSLNPEEFRLMVSTIRDIEPALGIYDKDPTPAERQLAKVARKVLVATEDISVGTILSEKHIDARRGQEGFSPMYRWSLVGKPALRDYKKGEPI